MQDSLVILKQASQLTLKDHPPRSKKGLVKGHTWKLRMVLVIFIKTKYDRLNGQVGKTESCSSKDICNGGVHILIITWI